MAKIVVNMGTGSGRDITVIADAVTMEQAVAEIKEAIKAFSPDASKTEEELYKIIKVEH